MFILNLTKDNLVYRAHGLTLTLKPGVNLVHAHEFKAEELANHFGRFISILNDDVKVEIKEPEQNIAPTEDEGAPVVDETTPEVKDNTDVVDNTDEDTPVEEDSEVKDDTDENALVEEAKAPKKATKKATKKTNKK